MKEQKHSARLILFLFLMVSLFSCKPEKDLPTVKEVDLEKYMGTWYEIARLPNKFEKGLICVSATYTIKEDGKIDVLNKGHREDDISQIKDANGTAWVPDSNYPGRLKVSFFWPFAGNYYIIFLEENYKYVLVGDPSRKYLWILSRTKSLEESIVKDLLDIASGHGFDTEKVIRISQDCK